MLERYLLRYFLAVAEQASFSRAAERCCVSQPTLSVGIAKLEELLKAPLFIRSNRQVRLTPAGSRFLDHARRIEREFNIAQAAVADEQAPPIHKLGILHSIPGELLARMVAMAVRAAPRERFELVPGSARELGGKLAQGRIDAALTIMTGPTNRFLEQPLLSEGFALALPAAHPLAQRSLAVAEDVADEVMIVRRHCESLPAISRHFTDRGIRPHFALRASNDERVLQMIGAGLGVTVMPALYAAPDVRLIPLSGLGLRRTLGLAFATTTDDANAMSAAIVRAAADVLQSAERPVGRD